MKIRILLIILFLSPNLFYSQDFSESWNDHFSYLNVGDISRGESKVYGAAENAIFVYDFDTNDIERLSTVQGLSGETISTIKYIESSGTLLIGFVNGLMQVYVESTRDFVTVVDILDKPTIPPGDKIINHFSFYNGLVYVSAGFGISVYDINALEFGDTYYIGMNGTQINVSQTAVLDDYIYAATSVGVRKALVTSPNLVDYAEWQQIGSFNWIGIEAIESKIYLAAANKRLYELVGNSTPQRANYSHFIQDIRTSEGKLIVTTQRQVYIYDVNDISNADIINNIPDFISDFSSATLTSENIVYIGTSGDYFNSDKRGYGILKRTLGDNENQDVIHPESPFSNKAFSIEAKDNNVWVTYGDFNVSFNPFPLRKRGFSHLKGEEWINIPSTSVFDAVNLNTINVNPLNLNQVFISSFVHGLIEVVNDEPITLYSIDNSSFESQHPTITDIRNAASKIDKNGVLWCTNAKVANALKSFNIATGEWRSYDFSEIITNPTSSEIGYKSMDIGDGSVIWLGGYRLGIIGYDSENNLLKNFNNEEANMPSRVVRSVAVDKNNAVWVGTINGLRVIYNVSEFFNDPAYQLSEIIVLDNGEASELLFQQFINDIEVDGSNNKWIGTLGAGLYYFSADGQETIHHFTTDNSPLPSNDIIDIALDEVNGLVYIATKKGMVSFGSNTSKPEESLNEAYAYPNPVRPSFNITEKKVKIKGLTDNVNIKITDIEGNLVTEAESRTNLKFKGHNLEIDGGTALWNGKNLSDRVVASGVYLVMISDLDSLETKVLKVMIVR